MRQRLALQVRVLWRHSRAYCVRWVVPRAYVTPLNLLGQGRLGRVEEEEAEEDGKSNTESPRRHADRRAAGEGEMAQSAPERTYLRNGWLGQSGRGTHSR